MRLCRFFTALSAFLLLAGLVPAGPAAGQTPPALTIEQIMRGPDFVGTEPSIVGWSADGKKFYFRWKKPGEKKAGPYFITSGDSTPRKAADDELQKTPLADPSGRFGRYARFMGFGGGPSMIPDKAKKRFILNRDGDLALLRAGADQPTPLLQTDARETAVGFTADEKGVVFTIDENLFILPLNGGGPRQMTSFTRESPPEPPAKPDAIDKWYEDQQKELFRQFQQTDEEKDRRGMRRGGFPPGGGPAPGEPRRKPFPLSGNQSVYDQQLTADEKFVLFYLSESDAGEKQTIVPNYVTGSGFTETIPSRAKAGYPSSHFKAGLMDTATGEVKWVDFGQGEREVSPRETYWSPDRKIILLQVESADRKDAWLFRLDPATGKTTVLETVHDDAWIGEFGLTDVFFWPDGKFVSYISEKNGFAHLYKTGIDGSSATAFTSGRFEVRDASLSRDGKTIYLTTSEEHPGETHFYSLPAAGGPRTKITGMTGFNEPVLSPDEATLVLLHSSATKPPELYVQANKPGAKAVQVTLSTTDEFRAYPWAEPEVLSFKARDGADVYARLFRPKNQHPAKPAVIFIHGAGYLQNAHKGWSEYYHEYMFHNLLLERGYVVFDVDYRGSSGYGRDCRTAIYRAMGGKDLDDIVDAAAWLVKNADVAADRIGTYGGSYGGFLTLMAMFKSAGTFQAGAALRPVTDWAAYHPWYTVDILNRPQTDSEAYKQSSPIYFAEKLKGALLICHGLVDTNVHFQDSVRLAQRLIELGKENWEVAFYPVEDHSFVNAASWTDEYKRILKLFETNLKR
ncbi:MAG: S9 family peptidase [Candidatus Aminicenantales bacterium]